MLDALRLATIISLVLAIVLAVARGLPLARVLLIRYDAMGFDLRLGIVSVIAVGLLAGWAYDDTPGGAAMLASSWSAALLYW